MEKLNHLYDVIHVDIKTLIHFLKEEHKFYPFLKKLCNTNKNNKPQNYNEYYNFICNKSNIYISSVQNKNLMINNKWKEILIQNDKLLLSTILFATWSCEPLVLKNESQDENKVWCKATYDFIQLKKLIYGKLQPE